MQKPNISAWKIDRSLLETYGMVITTFQVFNKIGHSYFFQKNFSLANISMEVILGMFFLIFSNADVQFAEKQLTWRTYTNKEALSTTCWVGLISWKKFAKVALNNNIKAFMVYISSLGLKIIIHLARKAQVALLLVKKIFILTKYSGFDNDFSKKSANILSKQIRANKHSIKQKKASNHPMSLSMAQSRLSLRLLRLTSKPI